MAGATVTFEPGAHGLAYAFTGHTLIITACCGRMHRESRTSEEIRRCDGHHIEPKAKHWHAAAPTTSMTHIAIL